MFVDREAELAFLSQVQNRSYPGPGQLLMLYGRRRVGKTALLRHWAEQSGLPWLYWMAQKEPAPLQRRKLFAQILNRNPLAPSTPTFESWSDLWEASAPLLTNRKRLLIIDELPYAAEADPATLSALQQAWDLHFQHAPTVIALCGSHVRAMETLLSRQSPLFGRMTGQWHLQPLPFGALRQFFPTWSPEEQVAAYAIVGGVPTYLNWFDPALPLTDNIRQRLLAPGSLAQAEVEFLLYDEVREPRVYLSILQAIGNGAHTLSQISAAALIAQSNLSAYLATLQDLRLVERRIPATVPPAKQRSSKQGRYHLSDPFHRFYFRFLQPNEAELSYQPNRVLGQIQQGLRAFVGATAWEELARQWVLAQAHKDTLGFAPERIGSHWSRTVQADVIAINWKERTILIGECKWGAERVDKQTVRTLLEHTIPLVLADLPDKGDAWRSIPAFFARAGVTPAARTAIQRYGGRLVDADRLWADLEY
jgi:AAA+ ATPase superfamily predicted ATPase